MKSIFLFVTLTFGVVVPLMGAEPDTYGTIIRRHQPAAWWRFDAINDGVVRNEQGHQLSAHLHGEASLTDTAPRPSLFPDFSSRNQAVRIPRGENYFVMNDPGQGSPLDFVVGDGITLEAWIRIDAPLRGSYPYIIGKGRTHNPGTHPQNQSYSLRLATAGGAAAPSFFFVDETGTSHSIEEAGHRWTSSTSVPQDRQWHHVAVTYSFGKRNSLRAYIDGKSVSGKWDLAGATDKGPITDDDQLWIGSSMGGKSSLGASLDEVAIYRRALSEEEIAEHVNFDFKSLQFAFDEIPADVPTDHVRVEILEENVANRTWEILDGPLETVYETDLFAMKQIPRKYDQKGLIIDRAIPSLLRLSSSIEFAAGEYEFLLRSLDAARLYIDGKLLAETEFMDLNTNAHNPYYEMPDYGDQLLSLAAGHKEDRATVTLTTGRHVVTLYRILGSKGHGNYVGELSVGVARVESFADERLNIESFADERINTGKAFKFLAPTRTLDYTDAGWLTFLDEDRLSIRDWNQQRRFANSQAELDYWHQRHAWAKSQIGDSPEIPNVGDQPFADNPIDRFVLAKLDDQGLKPTGEISDWQFLRRVSLDTIGKIPSPKMIETYFSLPKETRRSRMIDQLLENPEWAAHWTTYWQDALAENPGLTKPQLNNSGPFRWFIYESLLDDKPFDRFVTELVMMEGSTYTGGPAGFSIASQNDVPMAAKAHILGTAFLAVEMKCARCHDAPYHDVDQKDLFSVAAMLKRQSEKVPGSSSIPLTEEEVADLAVQVTLQPGSSVDPQWPFVKFISSQDESADFPEHLIRDPNDSREQLARMLTSPKNHRFSKVIVNRIWQRLMGRGIVNPVDDWEEATASHPELLENLSQEFIRSGYDLKTISRLIMNSHVYQRAPVPGLVENSEQAQYFQGPVRRKMTGEQVVDSLYGAVGKPLSSEELTMDADGRRSDTTFGHFGIPTRAWEFTPVSNERDRPSMTLPVAQSIIDLMSAYGWRQQRQEPMTHREDPLTALQPMALSNGVSTLRAIDFSDDSALTLAAIESETVEEFVETLFERLLTRTPTSDERELLAETLREGFAERVIAGEKAVPPKRMFRTGITWSSHFDPKSDDEAIARMREVLEGDQKSVRLDPDWRERAEDAAWVLVNSPEFVFVP